MFLTNAYKIYCLKLKCLICVSFQSLKYVVPIKIKTPKTNFNNKVGVPKNFQKNQVHTLYLILDLRKTILNAGCEALFYRIKEDHHIFFHDFSKVI